jgi:muramoyltetrapeptide carboxypeptidase LdcA involved in peptidoglycan recycling
VQQALLVSEFPGFSDSTGVVVLINKLNMLVVCHGAQVLAMVYGRFQGRV